MGKGKSHVALHMFIYVLCLELIVAKLLNIKPDLRRTLPLKMNIWTRSQVLSW